MTACLPGGFRPLACRLTCAPVWPLPLQTHQHLRTQELLLWASSSALRLKWTDAVRLACSCTCPRHPLYRLGPSRLPPPASAVPCPVRWPAPLAARSSSQPPSRPPLVVQIKDAFKSIAAHRAKKAARSAARPPPAPTSAEGGSAAAPVLPPAVQRAAEASVRRRSLAPPAESKGEGKGEGKGESKGEGTGEWVKRFDEEWGLEFLENSVTGEVRPLEDKVRLLGSGPLRGALDCPAWPPPPLHLGRLLASHDLGTTGSHRVVAAAR